ncbi:hypothetical protein [Pseudobacteroides cellulosolvens]|nr:hypothetical protein [Pseudobacteroides cellulosolvens]
MLYEKVFLLLLLTAQVFSFAACSNNEIKGEKGTDASNTDKPASNVTPYEKKEGTSTEPSNTIKESIQNNANASDTNQQSSLLDAEDINLLSKLEGKWYDLRDKESVRLYGVKSFISVTKVKNDYIVSRNFPDTGVGIKITEVIKDGQNKYTLKSTGDNTGSPMEFKLDLSSDYKSMTATININKEYFDKEVKFVKYSSELAKSIELQRLSGKYLDINDKIYSFREEGRALWSGKKSFRFSILKNDEGSKPFIVAYGADRKEIARYSYYLLGQKLLIKDAKNDKVVLDLRRADSSDNLEQKAIDLVARKFNAVIDSKNDWFMPVYKSSLGQIYLSCTGTDKKGRYKVILSIDVFPDGSQNVNGLGSREFYVDVESQKIIEYTTKVDIN